MTEEINPDNDFSDDPIISDNINNLLHEYKEKERIRKEQAFLSKTSLELLNLSENENLFEYVGNNIKDLLGDNSIVTVNSFNNKTNISTLEALLGIGGHTGLVERILKSKTLKNMDFALPEEGKKGLMKDFLYEHSGGIHEISYGAVGKAPSFLLDLLLKKSYKTDTGYSMGLTEDDNLLGSVTIFMTNDQELECKSTIETFIHNVSVVMQKRLSNQNLIESELRFRSFYETSPNAVFVADRKGKSLLVNPNACKLTGYSDGELKKMDVSNLLFPEDKRLGIYLYKKLIINKELSEEIRLRKKDGTELYVLLNATQSGDNEYMVICTDITQKRKTDEAMRHSEKMRVIGQLAGGMAHDFNNKLGGIITFAEVLKKSVGDVGDNAMYLDNIKEISLTAAGLTKKLLRYSRNQPLSYSNVELNQILTDVSNVARSTLDKKVSFSIKPNADPSMIYADGSEIDNMIYNLILNAKDAMPDGGEIIMTTDNASLDQRFIESHNFGLKPGDYICLSIEDSGMGIKRENLERIFEPFFTTKEVGKGTGLGLAGVYGTVKSHNGTIEVYSEIDRGTEFKIYLPLSSSITIESYETDHILPGLGKLMLVDDEGIIRDSSKPLLEKLGYSVKTFGNGSDAVGYYKDNQDVGIVLLDLVMPGMDGSQVFYELKKINSDVKVILMSGYDAQSYSESLLGDGALMHVQKPINWSELSKTLKEIF